MCTMLRTKGACRWADPENAPADTEGWGQTEMWGGHVETIKHVLCSLSQHETNKTVHGLSFLATTLPLLALAQICQSLVLFLLFPWQIMWVVSSWLKLWWLTDAFNYPCLHKLTQLDNHKILKASLGARGLLSLPRLAVLSLLFPWGEQRFQSPAAKYQCCTHPASTE